MDYSKLPSGLIKCVVTSDELKKRGIDPVNFLDRPDLVKDLYDEITGHVLSVFAAPKGHPFIVEAVPTYDMLNVIISPGTDIKDDTTDGHPDLKADNSAPLNPEEFAATPVLLPIDELQASVISDLISAAENGNIIEHLKKYLNEDFLGALVSALSESGLESLINSFFSPPGADEAESLLTQSMADGVNDTAARLEGYIEQMNSLGAPSSSAENKKSHRRICVMAEFKALDDVERAVSLSHPEGFTGESYLFKGADNAYTLVLSQMDMPIQDFRKIAAPLMNFFKGREVPEATLFSLLEHETPLLSKNAVEALLGKI